MNRKEYYDKLRKWEVEGYDVSELRERWFPAKKAGGEGLKRNWIAIALAIFIVVAGVIMWQVWLEPTPAATPAPALLPEPVSVPTPAPSKTGTEEAKAMTWDEPPPMVIDTGKHYLAIMETEKGKLVLELFAEDVPKTVNNFVFLANQGYYDGTTFHRVIPGFMAQGGDPTGTGAGGPGYRFEDEFTSHTHVAGALSMANTGPNSNGSQFFITYVAVHQLDGKHTVFGQLMEGMDVLKNITPRDPTQNPQFKGDKIIRVDIMVGDCT